MTVPSIIESGAQVHPSARIGAYVRICSGAVIGPGCEIGDFCVIGQPTKTPAYAGRKVTVGEGSIIRSHTVIYEGSDLGPRLETGHHVVIREGTRAGVNLRVGNYTDVEGTCEIGDYCRFHGYVHVGRGSRIGHFVWLFSLTTLTNDPLPPSHLQSPVVIEDGVVVAVGCTLMPGTRLGEGAFVAAGSFPKGVVPPAAVYSQGQVRVAVTRLASLEGRISHPWMSHFKDAYPPEAHARLADLEARIRQHSLNLSARS
jgi:UDP-3-O-[3-hydroxymyristoyl] glucosamine N-acyltransferase